MAKNLGYEERFFIEKMIDELTVNEIAVRLKRAESTVRREIIRNSSNGEYSALLAQELASKRMAREQEFVLLKETEDFIVEHLKEKRWSPELISGELGKIGVQTLSHTYIYGYIQKNKENGGDLYKYLAHKPSSKEPKEYKGNIPNRVTIDKRPDEVGDRLRVGDFEADLIVSPKNQGAAILSIIERKSRYCLLSKVDDKSKDTVSEALISELLGANINVHTITTDNGAEFTSHEDISDKLNCDYYFANPYASYERGSVEQLNGLVRRFIPKGTKIDDIDSDYIKVVESHLNERPRNVLGGISPNEFLKNFGENIENVQLRV